MEKLRSKKTGLQSGRVVRLSWPPPMTCPLQATILLTLITWGFGDLGHMMNLTPRFNMRKSTENHYQMKILKENIIQIIINQSKRVKMLNILHLYSIQMMEIKRIKRLGLSKSTFMSLQHSQIYLDDSKSSINFKLSLRNSKKRMPFISMRLMLLSLFLKCLGF